MSNRREKRDRRTCAERSNTAWTLQPLEPRLLLSGDTHIEVTPLPDPALAALFAETEPVASAAPELSQTFALHSRPDADKRIYLDFDGHVTSGTSWNVSGPFTTPAFDMDEDPSTFSVTELERIQFIYQRVAEDFIPFDIDVTTEAPAQGDLTMGGGTDTRWGARIVIGGSGEWYGRAGGVAYVGSFNWGDDTPAFVFSNLLGDGEKNVAEAASHEAGHTLGLMHQGTATVTYYAGHGTGETAWAPIMGVGYYRNLSQWSKSEYPGAQNTYGSPQDDLAIITGGNGFGYRADDHGGTDTAATALALSGLGVTGSGIIERSTDADVFSFITQAGPIALTVSPAERGPNLDIFAELLDSTGAVIATSNPADLLGASFNLDVPGGEYFVRVAGTGKGDPLVDGYTSYASLGQYTIAGQVTPPPGALAIDDVTVDENAGVATFSVRLVEPGDAPISVTVATQNDSALAGSDYAAVTQVVTFQPGETLQQVSVTIADDAAVESAERFFVHLSDPTGGGFIYDGAAVGTIRDNDLPIVSVADASVRETNPGRKSTVQTTNMSFTVTLSQPSTQTVVVNYATADDTALAGSDYYALTGSLVFTPGQTSRTVVVSVIGDTLIETNETLRLILSTPTNAVIGDGDAVGTIEDNDTKKGGGGPRNSPLPNLEAMAASSANSTAWQWRVSEVEESDAVVW
jgi:hypothetical protein